VVEKIGFKLDLFVCKISAIPSFFVTRCISTARCAIANRNFYQLLKEPTISVDAHIPVFTFCLQDLNYNSEAPLKDVDVNVAFLASLGPS
jgi:hypothetical protein